MTEDRDKWRKHVHGVANPRIEEGGGTERNCLWWRGRGGYGDDTRERVAREEFGADLS